MEVAQAFNNKAVASEKPVSPAPHIKAQGFPTEEDHDSEADKSWERTVTPAAIKAERRRSAYEKYSNFSTLPALKEEKTPVPSPAGTLSKTDVAAVGSLDREEEGAQDLKVNAGA